MTATGPGCEQTIVESPAERRRAERLDYGLFARLRQSGPGRDVVPTWVVDLSSRGATLLAAQEAPGGALLLELQLGEHPVQLPVTIRNRCLVPEFESRSGPFYRYGVSFAPRLQQAECAEALASLR